MKHQLFEDYEIHIDGNGMSVQKDSGTKDKDGNAIYRIFGHYSALPGAINRIGQLVSKNKKGLDAIAEKLRQFSTDIKASAKEIEVGILADMAEARYYRAMKFATDKFDGDVPADVEKAIRIAAGH